MKQVVFNLTDEQYERLGRIAEKMGCDRQEALRRTLELYCIIKAFQDMNTQPEGE